MHIQLTLAIENIERSEHFYRNILQLEVERFTPPHAATALLLIRCGSSTLLLQEIQDFEAQHPAALQHLHRQARGVGVRIEFEIDHLEAVQRSLRHQQLGCLYELEDQQHGRREVWLYDPDHYLIALGQTQR